MATEQQKIINHLKKTTSEQRSQMSLTQAQELKPDIQEWKVNTKSIDRFQCYQYNTNSRTYRKEGSLDILMLNFLKDINQYL